jgi:hypothetical protein
MLPEFQPGSLRQITVTVEGAWDTGAPRLDWHGRAWATEPIVALTLNGFGRWAKSDRPLADGSVAVRLLLMPYDKERGDIQVNFSVGGGHALSRTTVPPDYRPTVKKSAVFRAGQLGSFAMVEGSRTVSLIVLFVCRSDVRIGRNGLWNLRPIHRESVSEPWRSVLSYGRSGNL